MSAAVAVAYISTVVLFLHFIRSIRHDTPDTILDGMGIISLFVLSAAIMAFLFFYQPVLRLLEGKRAEAVSYFLKTLGTFAVLTAGILALVSLQ